MVVRKQAALPKQYIYNAAFVAVFVVAGAFAFRSSFQTERVLGCAERSTLAAPLPVTVRGSRVSLVDLRARTGGAEWGLDDHVSMRLGNAGRDPVITVAFKGDADRMFISERRGLEIESRTSGFGFDWETDVLDGRRVGCLRYAVRVPKSFPRNGSGVLPGLVVREKRRGANESTPGNSLFFAMRWQPGGRFGLRIQRSNGAPGREYGVDVAAASLVPDQWHTIEQEVTLSSPGKADGGVRVWVNGDLQLDINGLKLFKSNLPLAFERVKAHVHFVDRNFVWQPAPAPSSLSLQGLTLHGFDG